MAPGRGMFVLACVARLAVGCGAVRRVEGGDAEIKRMYVAPANRGLGIGATVLEALVAEARAVGAARAVLETGERQQEALELYRRAGFEVIPCPCYGEYAEAPPSLCMALTLE